MSNVPVTVSRHDIDLEVGYDGAEPNDSTIELVDFNTGSVSITVGIIATGQIYTHGDVEIILPDYFLEITSSAEKLSGEIAIDVLIDAYSDYIYSNLVINLQYEFLGYTGSQGGLEIGFEVNATGSIINTATADFELDLGFEITANVGSRGELQAVVSIEAEGFQETIGIGVVELPISLSGTAVSEIVGDAAITVAARVLGIAGLSALGAGTFKIEGVKVLSTTKSVSGDGDISITVSLSSVGLQQTIGTGSVIIAADDYFEVASTVVIEEDAVLVKHRRDDWYGR